MKKQHAITSDQKQLYDTVTELLNVEQFDEARKLIYEKLTAGETIPLQAKLELYGFLIDIGCESRNEDDLKKGIDFFEEHETGIKELVSPSRYYYNLANAKHGLDTIFWINNPGVQKLTTNKTRFQEPINLYWLAFKAIEDDTDLLLNQIMINLSNTLMYTSRLVEAIQFLDMVLKKLPYYPQALLSKGDHLHFLSEYTNCSVTIALYKQIFNCFYGALKTGCLPPAIAERSKQYAQMAVAKIKSHGYDITYLEKDIAETAEEYHKLPVFRKFCIDNFLTLTEHGVYCNCKETATDDLQIGVPFGTFRGYLVPKLELLLNRIKSEFAIARWDFYKSQKEEAFDYNVLFSELLDGEIINSQTEMLRTSYRICYGILDKIALGICKLYGIKKKRIYFESFWSDTSTWKILDQQKNIHLNALYSIACDLNTNTGELKHFKEWRNMLEHNLLILKNKDIGNEDPLHLYEDKEFVAVVDLTDFTDKALHLLQLTRAAIFSYVYCVRLQTIEHPGEGNDGKPFEIKFKG